MAAGALRPHRDAPDVGIVDQRRRGAVNRMFGRRVRPPGQHDLQPGGAWKHRQHNTFRRPQGSHPGNRIQSGDNAVFGISGSGQTVGAALYTFDDLPDSDAPRCPRPTRPQALLDQPATS